LIKSDFFNIQYRTVETSEGPVQVPVSFYDGAAVMAFFPCGYDAALSKLEGTGFVPFRMFNGKALAVMGFFEYRDSSFGPYKEITLMFPVFPDNSVSALASPFDFFKKIEKRRVGFHIIDLPITGELPLAAGRELWGFPKFKADIEYGYGAREFEAEVRTYGTGDTIFTFRSPFLKGMRAPFTDCLFYTYLDNTIRRSVVIMNSGGKMTTGRRALLSAGTADHRMLKNLCDLGMANAKPLFIQSTGRLQYNLYECDTIRECPTPELPYCG